MLGVAKEAAEAIATKHRIRDGLKRRTQHLERVALRRMDGKHPLVLYASLSQRSCRTRPRKH